eukprot:12789661-Alexandrium_andersonii.AAC.1
MLAWASPWTGPCPRSPQASWLSTSRQAAPDQAAARGQARLPRPGPSRPPHPTASPDHLRRS